MPACSALILDLFHVNPEATKLGKILPISTHTENRSRKVSSACLFSWCRLDFLINAAFLLRNAREAYCCTYRRPAIPMLPCCCEVDSWNRAEVGLLIVAITITGLTTSLTVNVKIYIPEYIHKQRRAQVCNAICMCMW